MFGIFKSIFSTDINKLSDTKALRKAIEAEDKKDYILAKQLYEIVIKRGFQTTTDYAQNNLALLYKNGLGVPKDIEKAKELLNEAKWYNPHTGYYPCAMLNLKYFQSSKQYKSPKDDEKALDEYIELANNGDVEIQYQLHDIFERGYYAEKDYNKEQYWFNLAAKNGHESALISIKVDKKMAEEAERDKKAIREAERGDLKGLYDLAIMILHYRKSEDYEGEFVDLIEKSASKGYLKAQYFLGLLFESGHYLNSYERGGEKGLVLGPMPESIPSDYIPNFNSMHFFNPSNNPNVSEAIKWYKKSGKQGYQPAINRLEYLGVDIQSNFNINEKDFWDISDEDYYEEDSILDKYGIDYIYHMTHYKNLESILVNGLLAHNNELVDEHIDNAEVNDRRNKIEPIYHKNLHTYVPFYFNPKNPMLFVNKEIQEDIVILAFNKNLLIREGIIFTDGNAAVNKTKFYGDLNDLEQLNWSCINSRYWNDYEDGKREVMAEILIPNKVNITQLKKIYCYDEATESFIQDLDDELDIEINTKLYF